MNLEKSCSFLVHSYVVCIVWGISKDPNQYARYQQNDVLTVLEDHSLLFHKHAKGIMFCFNHHRFSPAIWYLAMRYKLTRQAVIVLIYVYVSCWDMCVMKTYTMTCAIIWMMSSSICPSRYSMLFKEVAWYLNIEMPCHWVHGDVFARIVVTPQLLYQRHWLTASLLGAMLTKIVMQLLTLSIQWQWLSNHYLTEMCTLWDKCA